MSKDTVFRPINRLWTLLKPDYSEIRNIYLYAVFAGLISLTLPLGIQAIVNFIQMGQISTSWIVLVIVVVLGVLISGLLQIFQLRITENLQQKIFVRNAFNFANKIPKMKTSLLDKRYAPELMNRFMETTSIQKGISKLLIDFIAATLQIIMGMILLSFYHPFFVLLSLLLLFLFFFVFRFLYKRGIQTSLNESKYKFQLQSWLEEMSRNIFLFKNHASEEWHLEKTNSITEKYLVARDNHFRILKTNYYFLILFKVLMITGLLLLGGYLVIHQKMNIGQFVASEIIILLLMASIEKLTTTIEVFFDVLTSLEKVGEVTDISVEIASGIELNAENKINSFEIIPMDNSVEVFNKSKIQQIKTAHHKEVFHSVIGWKESSLVQIKINELSLNNYNIKTYRRRTNYINGVPEIFEGTLFENLILGKPKSDLTHIGSIINICKLNEYIDKLENGLQERLNPAVYAAQDAFTLKISIARVLINQPDVIFIHNDFTLLEPNEAKEIAEQIKKGNWKIVVIGENKYLI